MNGKIWVLGDAVVDLLPDGEGRLLQCPGGAPANVAVEIDIDIGLLTKILSNVFATRIER